MIFLKCHKRKNNLKYINLIFVQWVLYSSHENYMLGEKLSDGQILKKMVIFLCPVVESNLWFDVILKQIQLGGWVRSQ